MIRSSTTHSKPHLSFDQKVSLVTASPQHVFSANSSIFSKFWKKYYTSLDIYADINIAQTKLKWDHCVPIMTFCADKTILGDFISMCDDLMAFKFSHRQLYILWTE